MAGSITINNKNVLNYTSSFLQIIYYEIEDVLGEYELSMTQDFEYFIEKFKIAAEKRTPFLELAEYLKSSQNIKLLMHILEKVIYRIKDKIYKSSIDDLWKFYGELRIYGEQLAAEGR